MPRSPIRSIAIMFHERDTRPWRENYRIWPIAENWRRSGIDVRIVHGPAPCLDADILVPHIDCSRIPDNYWQAIQQHPRAVNRRLRDISKTTFSQQLLAIDSDYDGPVIVKTNHNSGGFKDLDFGRDRPQSIRDQLRKRLAWHPWVAPHCLGWTHTLRKYPIFNHISQVPVGAWRNPHLVVEKFFTPDRDANGDHVLYMWITLGRGAIGRTLHSSSPVVKNASSRLGVFIAPPPEVQAVQARLGCDYAKIDYIRHEGRPIILDINRTPTLSGDAFANEYVPQNAPLAEGIESIGRARVPPVDHGKGL